MLNKLTIIIVLILCTLSMGVTLNLQSGVALTTTQWDKGYTFWGSSYDSSREPGFSLLFGADYLERGRLNLSSNMGIVHKGSYVGYTIGNNVTENKGLTYLSMNTMADYKLGKLNRLKPFFSIGPRLDVVIHNDPVFDQLPQFNKYAFGINYGGGIKYLIGSMVIGARFDYCQNLTGIAKWDATSNYSSGEIDEKSSLISLIVGYILK